MGFYSQVVVPLLCDSGWVDHSWRSIAVSCSPTPAATFWKSASQPA